MLNGYALNEFSLINTWFKGPSLQPCQQQIIVDNGDDGAAIDVPKDQVLVQSIDTQVAGIHFPASAPAALIGYRALAAAVSDLAAMGASAHSYFLALTVPEGNSVWLSEFSRGLAKFTQRYGIALIGGDTTKGPLTISLHVQGFASPSKLLKRSGAQVGDAIFVSGTLGDAGAALPWALKGKRPDGECSDNEKHLLTAYYSPTPQIKLGQWLTHHGVTTAIDISDGLLADLSHILTASDVGARIDIKKLPLSEAINAFHTESEAYQLALHAGDDYQLCFCWPKGKALPKDCPVNIHKIGVITEDCGLFDNQGKALNAQGFSHF